MIGVLKQRMGHKNEFFVCYDMYNCVCFNRYNKVCNNRVSYNQVSRNIAFPLWLVDINA